MPENPQMTQELDVSPKKIRAKTGYFQITISNRGEGKNEYRLIAEDPDKMCVYNFDADTVTVDAGATVTTTLIVRFKDTLPTGAPKTCNFTVRAAKSTGEAETAQGQLERPARLPIWAWVAGGVAAVAAIVIVAVLVCGGGDETCAPAASDVSGSWTLDVWDVDSSCGPEPSWTSYITIVQQEDGSLEVTGIKQQYGNYGTVSGKICGNKVTIGPEEFSEGGGTTTAKYVMTVSSDYLMEGYEKWTWTGGGETCSGGTATISATKN
jgi:hypothetical protein